MGNYGLKVSPAGTNVKSVTDKEARFTSKYSTLKLYAWDDTSVTTNGSGNATKTIAHNLGYAPAFLLWQKGTAEWDFLSGNNTYSNAFFPVGAVNYYDQINGNTDPEDASNYGPIAGFSDDTNFYIDISGGKPSTTYYFRYYILVDLAEAFSSAGGPATSGDYGFKVAKPGFPVKTAKEYQLAFSTKYKCLQFYDVNIYSQSLTLPAMFASHHDNEVMEGTYVDFVHELGFPPLFMGWFEDSSGDYVSIPLSAENGIDLLNYGINGFVDSTRIRIYFWRRSHYVAGLGGLQENWSAETVTIKMYAFYENLAGTTNPLPS